MKKCLVPIPVIVALALQPTTHSLAYVKPVLPDCKKVYAMWKTKPKHKAYAISNSYGWQACGASWSEASVEAAEKSAKRLCKQSAEEGSCGIVKSE